MTQLANIERSAPWHSVSKKLRLTIRSSPINGNGLFVLDNISADQVVYQTSDYFVGAVPIYGSVQRSSSEHITEKYLRRVNHSCKPNCRLEFDGAAIKLVAITNIEKGSELLCDYGETEDSIPNPFICNCAKCSGRLLS